MPKRTKNVYEVLDEAKGVKTLAEKTKIIRNNQSGALHDVIRGVYDKTIVWLFDKDYEPDYKPCNEHNVYTNLIVECKRLKFLAKGLGYDNLAQGKRERILTDLLESIHPRDAEIIVDMIKKKPIAGVGRKVCERAIPGLIKDPVDAITGYKAKDKKDEK